MVFIAGIAGCANKGGADATVPDPHPSLPPLEAVDLTFSTHLQLGLQHQRVVANDELAYLLDGASPKWPSAARIPAPGW